MAAIILRAWALKTKHSFLLTIPAGKPKYNYVTTRFFYENQKKKEGDNFQRQQVFDASSMSLREKKRFFSIEIHPIVQCQLIVKRDGKIKIKLMAIKSFSLSKIERVSNKNRTLICD